MPKNNLLCNFRLNEWLAFLKCAFWINIFELLSHKIDGVNSSWIIMFDFPEGFYE